MSRAANACPCIAIEGAVYKDVRLDVVHSLLTHFSPHTLRPRSSSRRFSRTPSCSSPASSSLLPLQSLRSSQRTLSQLSFFLSADLLLILPPPDTVRSRSLTTAEIRLTLPSSPLLTMDSAASLFPLAARIPSVFLMGTVEGSGGGKGVIRTATVPQANVRQVA